MTWSTKQDQKQLEQLLKTLYDLKKVNDDIIFLNIKTTTLGSKWTNQGC
jgi:hypothetical protein